ncbi:hypothetical protein NLI96_g7934 [Meripilus lineatus]|uniref:CBS domain-containing protein n=1 Tax=Meripilus lineatus TaxID=2056292 RepID=A0AAD5UY84_9APHY|nr:hypothetical protein NLI96_g7934 [Physisporinus lineatus]
MATVAAASASAPFPGTSQSLSADKYRGAVVEDLQLPPAFAVSSDEEISRAIEMAYERDFSHIPVLDDNRKPLGYVDVARLKTKWEAGEANPVSTHPIGGSHSQSRLYAFGLSLNPKSDKVKKYMTKFKRSSSEPYTLITPSTPLADLEEFLRHNIFALGTAPFLLPPRPISRPAQSQPPPHPH